MLYFPLSSTGSQDLGLIATVAAGFTAAWVLGLFTQWLKLSPIVGYLLAGVAIGPNTPGFDGDPELAAQLAEIGVILLMFGVGLHFHLKDLLAVKSIAIPGAMTESVVVTSVAVLIFMTLGLELRASVVLGMAMAVASTVVLMRVLIDAHSLNSPQGHVAVGWLLVEDILTVVALVFLPVIGGIGDTEPSATTSLYSHPAVAIGAALLKLVAMVALILTVGPKVVPWVLLKVARLRSRELFTLTVMVFSIAIATGTYVMFGASMALGAFLAGMLVAQTPLSHHAASDALPMRDAFAVLFFVSVGMLFDPKFLVEQPLMILAALGIILVVKPLTALSIVTLLGNSSQTALTVALGVAQIGEFSFILSNVAKEHGLMSHAGQNTLVGGAIISITLNPLLFRSLDTIERWLKHHPKLWNLLNARAQARGAQVNADAAERIAESKSDSKRRAIVVGYGPVGRTVDRLLRESGLETVVIEMNTDTVLELEQNGQLAIMGDASREAILELAGVQRASHLVITLPQTASSAAIVSQARQLNQDLKIFVRARYLREREHLEDAGASASIFEEAEAAVALARLVLVDAGAGRDQVERSMRDVRLRLILDNISNLNKQTVRSIMVPWTRVHRLSSSSSLDNVRRQIGEQHHSRWPVVDSQSGAPIGYLLAKDLIGLGSDDGTWTDFVRPLGAVSPDHDIESVLQQFQYDGATILSVQHRGSITGIITIEDILEQVVGRIEDEYPQRPKIALQDYLFTSRLLMNLESETADAAINEMASRIALSSLPLNADVAGLAIARERELPTNLGFGVAIPHARVANLEQPLVVFGRSSQGVLFSGRSPEQVFLIFLLVTPIEQPDLQVSLLSQIATVVGDRVLRDQLKAAGTEADVIDILAKEGDGPLHSDSVH